MNKIDFFILSLILDKSNKSNKSNILTINGTNITITITYWKSKVFNFY